MKMMNLKQILGTAAIATTLSIATGGHAEALSISNYENRATYLSTTNPQEEITFTDFQVGTVISNNYNLLGVDFVGGNDVIYDSSLFITDGKGLNGNGQIELLFSEFITAIGFDYIGALEIEIFQDNTSLGTSLQGGAGTGHFFLGITSDTIFNRVIVRDWDDGNAYVDNILFDQIASVPEPLNILGTATALGFGALFKKKTGKKDS